MRRVSGLVFATLLLTGGCLGATPHPVAHLRVPSPAAASLTPPLPSPLEHLATTATVACRWHTAPLPAEVMEATAAGAKTLRFAVGGPAFATVFGGDAATLSIPVALASAGGELEVESGGITVRGHMETAEMPLYPARPVLLGEVYLPTLRVTWRAAAAPGKLRLAVDDVSHVRPASGRASFEADGTCEDLLLGAASSLTFADYEKKLGAPGALAGPRPPPPYPFLKAGTTWVGSTPDAEPVAAIEGSDPPDDSILLRLEILETRGTKARVVFPGYGGILVGWIDRDRLRFRRDQSIDLSHDSLMILVRERKPRPDDVVCPQEMALVAALGGERHVVGTVHAGARVHVVSASSGWSDVDFPAALVGAREPATFAVRSVDLASCRRAPAPPS
jgi:hypothetical protein